MSRSNKELTRITDPLPNTHEMREWCEDLKAQIKRDRNRHAEVRTFRQKQLLQVWADLPKGYNEHGRNPYKKIVV